MSDSSTAEGGPRSLAGARCWIISDGKAGHESQSRGVAEALGADVEVKRIAPRRLWALIAPWGPVDPRERFGSSGSTFAPPWPQIAIATGRGTIPYIRALKRAAGPAVFTVALQDPRAGARVADLVWVPEHDALRAANVVTSTTAPHAFSASRLEALRARVPDDIARLPWPRVAMFVGGPSRAWRFSTADEARLVAIARSLDRSGASLLVTTSRRTPPSLTAALDAATATAPRIFYKGEGPNRYADFLAHADVIVVTGDSVSMTGEACATGRPVWVFMPSGGSAKFERFHEALRAHGATKRCGEVVDPHLSWTYAPLRSADQIARAIEARYERRKTMLSGLIAGNAPEAPKGRET
jgi:mitochondrial fission protein ELM1